jgi:hypothetical protein
MLAVGHKRLQTEVEESSEEETEEVSEVCCIENTSKVNYQLFFLNQG